MKQRNRYLSQLEFTPPANTVSSNDNSALNVFYQGSTVIKKLHRSNLHDVESNDQVLEAFLLAVPSVLLHQLEYDVIAFILDVKPVHVCEKTINHFLLS